MSGIKVLISGLCAIAIPRALRQKPRAEALSTFAELAVEPMLRDVEVGPLGEGAERFGRFTFARYRPLLARMPQEVLAIAATIDGAPAGLALWHCGDAASRLLSIRVRPDRRRRGIARLMLQTSDPSLPQDSPLAAWWSAALPGAAAFERLLADCGWGARTLDSYRCSFTPATIEAWARGRTLGRMGAGIGGFTWGFWDDLSEADHAAIVALEADPSFPDQFSPTDYRRMGALDGELSAVLRCRGTPVGWCLTQKVGAEVWYDAFWTRPDYIRSGVQLAMLLFMIRRQGQLLGDNSIGRFIVRENRTGMMALVRGPLRPCFTAADEYWVARKSAGGARPSG